MNFFKTLAKILIVSIGITVASYIISLMATKYRLDNPLFGRFINMLSFGQWIVWGVVIAILFPKKPYLQSLIIVVIGILISLAIFFYSAWKQPLFFLVSNQVIYELLINTIIYLPICFFGNWLRKFICIRPSLIPQ